MKLLEKEMIELNQQFANKEEAIRYCGKNLLRPDMLIRNTSTL